MNPLLLPGSTTFTICQLAYFGGYSGVCCLLLLLCVCVVAILVHIVVVVAVDVVIREVKHDVNGRRQTAKVTSDFKVFSSNR